MLLVDPSPIAVHNDDGEPVGSVDAADVAEARATAKRSCPVTTTAVPLRSAASARLVAWFRRAVVAVRRSSPSPSAASAAFPDNWNINLADPIDEFHAWVRDNQRTHPVFEYFFQPISDVVDWSLETLAEQLQALPWFALPLDRRWC